MNGDTFKNEVLMDRFGLQVNKTSINSVLFIVTIGATWGALSYLLEALTTIAQDLQTPARAGQSGPAEGARAPGRRAEHRPAAAAGLQPLPRAVPAPSGQPRG